MVHRDAEIEQLVLSTGTIITTPNHPFYTLDRGWVEAGDLAPGELIATQSGSAAQVLRLSVLALPTVMWDLTVDGVHTFFVGPGRALVHNCPRSVLDAVTRNGGTAMDNGYLFGSRRAAQQAASEVAGNLGNKPTTLLASLYQNAPGRILNVFRIYGKVAADESAGWRDDFLGHGFDLRPHFNAWNGAGDYVHFFYGG